MADEHVPQGIDPTVPSVARMYDYYLGGKDNFRADREAAEQIVRIARESGSDVREIARANRGFLIRAVRHVAEAGVRQFLDIGTGLPTQDNVHQVVQRVAPESKVVYVDNDPIVLVHAQALLADNPGTFVVEGDLRRPGDILKAAAAHLDFDRPVAIVVAAVLHFVQDDDEVARIVSTLRDALAPGGYLALSHGYIEPEAGDPGRIDEARGVYRRSASGSIAWRDRETVRGYFDGLELLEPGIVPAQEWHNDDPYVPPELAKGGVLAGVGRLPGPASS
ncbi:SAM-dependent methyltransferase [Nonomuraea candida]|uniref:SAM-dependent methyltransferase n=1 Tax=Nonomuraea candida TaxID=359159 RepID=UPI0005BC5220|nr:SAM-dependent methyltransferase [Nonomuraea candida]